MNLTPLHGRKNGLLLRAFQTTILNIGRKMVLFGMTESFHMGMSTIHWVIRI